MMHAARKLARLALLMAHEPTTTGAMGLFVGECAIDVSAGACAPEVHDDDHSSLVYVVLFVWCTAMTLLLAAAVWIGIKRIRAIEADAGHLALQVAQADTSLGEHMVAIPEVQHSMGQMRTQVTENASHMEMLADSVDWIHYGLVDSGNWRIRPPSRIDPSSKTSRVHCGAGQPCGNECHWTFPIHGSKSGIRAMVFCMGWRRHRSTSSSNSSSIFK